MIGAEAETAEVGAEGAAGAFITTAGATVYGGTSYRSDYGNLSLGMLMGLFLTGLAAGSGLM